MNEYLMLYGACALIIAIAANVVLLSQILKMAKEAGVQTTIVENVITTRITFFCISLLFAPVMFIVMMFSPLANAFVIGAYAGMTKE
jgi:hypothetical protein